MIELNLNTEIYLQLALFLVTIVVGIALTRGALMPLIAKLVSKREGDIKAVHSVQNIGGIIGLFITFTVALQVAGFGNLLTLLGTIAAAATVAIGFGMRDQISSLVAGIFIHTDNPYVKGDYIEIDGYEGVVKEVRLRATVIETESHPKQVVPNNIVTTKTLKNYTRGRKTRRNIQIKSDVENAEKAADILLETIEAHEDIWDRPAASIDFKSFEEGNVVIEASFWIGKPEEIRRIQDEILRTYRTEADKQDLISKEES